MKRLVLFILFILCFTEAAAQDLEEEQQTSSFFNRKFISVTAVSGIYAFTLLDSYLIWWRDDRRPFTFMEGEWFDGDSEKGMDKLGHFYTSYVFYRVQKNIFLWGGYTPETSMLLSGSLTAFMALMIEVGDGFSRYGFDYKDFVFNTGGLAYAILQDEVPFFQNINFKWSYWPSDGFAFPPRFSNHYEGHIYWLTFNIHGIMQPITGSFWPEYIQPAVGYSISKMLEREYIVGLDINLMPLFRSENPLIQYAGDLLNLFHIPSPGIKYTDDHKPEYKIFLKN
jgi:hypothetical protein